MGFASLDMPLVLSYSLHPTPACQGNAGAAVASRHDLEETALLRYDPTWLCGRIYSLIGYIDEQPKTNSSILLPQRTLNSSPPDSKLEIIQAQW